MAEIALLIGLIGITVFAGYVSSIFFEKTKIPDVLLLILLGIIIGSIPGLLDKSILSGIAGLVGTIALIIIVFDGSTKLNFFEVLDELPESVWFTLAVSTLTAIFVMFSLLVAVIGMDPLHGLLAGIIVAGTSYEIIVPLVAKLTVKEKVKTLLNLESAFNDIITIIGLIVILSYFNPTQTSAAVDPVRLFVVSFSVAIILGIVAGIIWIKVLQNYKGKPFEYLLTFACVFILFWISEIMQGNGITSVLLFGLILGNSEAIGKYLNIKEDLSLDPAIYKFNNEISFFVRTMFFVYMGIVINLSGVTYSIIAIAFLMVLASLIARFVAVKMLTHSNTGLKDSEFILTVMMPRGLATAVLAALPAAKGIEFPGLIEIIIIFMLLTNIFATAATFYYENWIVLNAAGQKNPVPKK